MNLQVTNSIRMEQRKKGEWRERGGEVGRSWLVKDVPYHRLSSLDFIPPVMERECTRLPVVLRATYTPSTALSCIAGIGNLGIHFPALLSAVFQFKVHAFRIRPDSEGTRRKSKATITPPIVQANLQASASIRFFSVFCCV